MYKKILPILVATLMLAPVSAGQGPLDVAVDISDPSVVHSLLALLNQIVACTAQFANSAVQETAALFDWTTQQVINWLMMPAEALIYASYAIIDQVISALATFMAAFVHFVARAVGGEPGPATGEFVLFAAGFAADLARDAIDTGGAILIHVVTLIGDFVQDLAAKAGAWAQGMGGATSAYIACIQA